MLMEDQKWFSGLVKKRNKKMNKMNHFALATALYVMKITYLLSKLCKNWCYFGHVEDTDVYADKSLKNINQGHSVLSI